MKVENIVNDVIVKCTGCDSPIDVGHLCGLTPENLVATLETYPPICIVCAYRPVFGPRAPVEVWEPLILGLEEAS